MNPSQEMKPGLKEVATQTEETAFQHPISYQDETDISEDVLKMKYKAIHQKASNYINQLETKYSKKNLNHLVKRLGELRNFWLSFDGPDAFTGAKSKAQKAILQEYKKMADDGPDGYIIIIFIEFFYEMSGRFESWQDEYFPELLSMASQVMNNPGLLKIVYNLEG